MGKIKRIDCHKCRHYFVTWVPSSPHGCHAMGFRSSQLPSAVVYKNSGSICKIFERKKMRNPIQKADQIKGRSKY